MSTQQLRAANPSLQKLDFSQLAGWKSDNPLKALEAFLRSCESRRWPKSEADVWQFVCEKAQHAVEQYTPKSAQNFFETYFYPYKVKLPAGKRGFLTGYYEPEVRGSRVKTREYQTPIYQKPSDLVSISGSNRPSHLDRRLVAARKTSSGKLVPYYTRDEIEAGALAGKNLELAYLSDPVDAFFIHVQGSARVKLDNGEVMRIGYAGKNGQPYSSIGKVLVEENGIPVEEMTMQWIRNYFDKNPKEVPRVTAHNKSFIFFREIHVDNPNLGPKGAQEIPLVPERSLAVDLRYHTLGTPIWLDTTLPAAKEGGKETRFRKLMIAQDTGTAIRGPARGDIFLGSGEFAGEIAGRTQQPGDFYILLPRQLQP